MATVEEQFLRLETINRELARLYALLVAGDIPSDEYDRLADPLLREKATIEAALAAAGVPEEPAPPPIAPESEFISRYGNIGTLRADPEQAGVIASAIKGVFSAAGLTPEALTALAKSPAEPSVAAAYAGKILTGLIAGLAGVYTIGIVAEAASFGQMEGITNTIRGLTDNIGMGLFANRILSVPFDPGLFKPATQYYNSVFTPEIPGSGDLIRMVVREVLTPDLFKVFMARQGFSSAWSDNYWEAHWVLPARGEIVDAYHRGLISKAEYEKYIIWHDYKPEVRPGISKSDVAILTGLMKELIPRVDLRRAWELGIIGDARLLKGYQDLGYEDDSPLMVEIQKAISLGAERSAVARVAGRCFRDGKIPESRFREELTKMGIGGEAQDLWVLRFQWERMAKPATAEEAAEEVTGATTETVP